MSMVTPVTRGEGRALAAGAARRAPRADRSRDHNARMPPLRIVQWSTGYVGKLAIRAIAHRPDLELAGVWVHSPEKADRDAGELAGTGPLGVRATTDAGALLALEPDCVCYSASGESRPGEAVDDFCRILEAGINVVTTSVPG